MAVTLKVDSPLIEIFEAAGIDVRVCGEEGNYQANAVSKAGEFCFLASAELLRNADELTEEKLLADSDPLAWNNKTPAAAVSGFCGAFNLSCGADYVVRPDRNAAAGTAIYAIFEYADENTPLKNVGEITFTGASKMPFSNSFAPSV